MTARSWIRKLFARPPRSQRRSGPRQVPDARFRPTVEALEDRLVPATFKDNGTTLSLVLTKASTNAAIVATSTPSYTLTLSNGDTWSGTNDGNVTGNGTATLTVTAAGIGAFTNQISIIDAAAGSDSVTFNNSGTNSYANNFTINLSNAAAGAIAFNGTSSFSGASTLTA